MKRVLIVSWCLWMTVSLQAQDFRKDFMTVYQSYATMNHYTQEVDVRSFTANSTTKPTYKATGKIVKSGANYYSTMDGQHTIIKGKQFLHVNTNDKRMLYYQKEQSTNNGMEQYANLLDSMKAADVIYAGASGNIKRYVMRSPEQAITKTELSLDMERRVITKIVYYYKKAEQQSALYKTVITYQTETKNRPSNTWFDTGKYIRIDKGRASVQTAYNSYRLTQPDDNEAVKRKFDQ